MNGGKVLVHTVVCMHLISAKYMYHAYLFCQLLDGDQTAWYPQYVFYQYRFVGQMCTGKGSLGAFIKSSCVQYARATKEGPEGSI